ncbi:RuBisCO large subunit C-terminal-like domain-containing protein [Acidithiobacillus thiooxidans]|uniref:RuBisCO large subunit C-terminal-like domain-containing protein n=1 Tax=Acidithiobacillus thiooxidans TaxID=930 RepID=UPI0035678180
MSAYIEVDYQFPAGVDAQRQAQAIAIGQTAGSWDARFQHREEQLRGHLAEVRAVHDLPEGRHLATIRFPAENVDGRMGSLLTMIFGKYSLAGPAKVMSIRLPEGYGQSCRFGLAGIREKLNVAERPLIMAIFKPALGLSAGDHAEILAEVAMAGLDIIKDDEILPDLPSAATLARWEACAPIIEARRDRTGRDLLYAMNLSGDARQVQEQARQLVARGANALLLNVLAYGFPMLEALAADPEVNVPIFAHPALAGAWCAAPDYGFTYASILGTAMSYAGADAVLYPAHYGSLPFPEADEQAIVAALRARGVAPVPSAGVHPGMLGAILEDYGPELILNAGTGIMDHPMGPSSGVLAFHEGLERWQEGASLKLSDLPAGPLRAAVEKWGAA